MKVLFRYYPRPVAAVRPDNLIGNTYATDTYQRAVRQGA
jgi:hypothetical protein